MKPASWHTDPPPFGGRRPPWISGPKKPRRRRLKIQGIPPLGDPKANPGPEAGILEANKRAVRYQAVPVPRRGRLAATGAEDDEADADAGLWRRRLFAEVSGVGSDDAREVEPGGLPPRQLRSLQAQHEAAAGPAG